MGTCTAYRGCRVGCLPAGLSACIPESAFDRISALLRDSAAWLLKSLSFLLPFPLFALFCRVSPDVSSMLPYIGKFSLKHSSKPHNFAFSPIYHPCYEPVHKSSKSRSNRHDCTDQVATWHRTSAPEEVGPLEKTSGALIRLSRPMSAGEITVWPR